MNHYEIVFVVDPQLDKEAKLFNKCLDTVTSIKGITHRSEDIGIRKLAYPINDKNSGHYFLLNIECNSESLKDIESLFKFEESIMRSSIVKKKRAETEPSSLFTQTQNVQKSNEMIDQTAEDKKPNESKNNSEEETNASSELESSESDKE